MARLSSSPFPLGVFLLNLWPLAHLVGVAALWRTPVLALAALYLLPPLAARILIAVAGRPQGKLSVGSRDFLVWWSLACLQSIYVRLPLLEELLKFPPLVYSAWLRLWGSKIGKMVYWAPGVCLLDRSYLRVGDRVVVGVGSKLCPHYRKDDLLVLAPITLEHDCQVGGFALLTPGVVVAARENVPATLRIRPFSKFMKGRIWRGAALAGEGVE